MNKHMNECERYGKCVRERERTDERNDMKNQRRIYIYTNIHTNKNTVLPIRGRPNELGKARFYSFQNIIGA